MNCLRLRMNVAMVALATLASTAAVAGDWPQWLGPNRDNQNTETGLLKSWPADGPERVWLFEECGLGYAGPAIVDGRIYILGSREKATSLLCLDEKTGEELWAAPVGEEYKNRWGNGPRNTPTVDGDHVFALGAKGDLVCVTKDQGKEVWRASLLELGGSIPQWGFAESVLVDGRLVLCTPGGSQGAVVAFDRATGEVAWQTADLNDGAHYSSIIKAAPHGHEQYIQLLEKRLIGLSPTDGKLLWELPWPGRVAVIPTPVYHDNVVYVTTGYGVGCMAAKFDESGKPTALYDNKVMKNKHDGVVRLGNHLYGYSDGVGWLCQDMLTGERVWRERSGLDKGSIGYADGMLYCLTEKEGVVALLEATTEGYKEVSRFTLAPLTEQRSPQGGIWVHPVIANGKLYLRDQEKLFCFDVKE